MRLSVAGVTLTFWLVGSPVAAEAQVAKVPQVGFLCWVACGDAYHDAFWQALRSLGYADYRNIAFENRAAGGDDALLDTLAVQLVNLKPAVIVTDTTQAARALRKATETIPLVVIADDPVGSEFISNLARPEGNVTGLSLMAVELGAKQLQLLEEAVPGASRVAVLGNPANPATALRLRALEAAGRASGVRVLPLDVRTPSEHVNAFAVMAQMHADALIDILGRQTAAIPRRQDAFCSWQ
jgi:putative tryptophan/tyrosine transport system substrate-binding protein